MRQFLPHLTLIEYINHANKRVDADFSSRKKEKKRATESLLTI
jgi:hypothetical protein